LSDGEVRGGLHPLSSVEKLLKEDKRNEHVNIGVFLIIPLPGKAQQQALCYVALVLADGDANSIMSQSEYAPFVNRLSSGAFTTSYDQLPQALQDNFVALVALDNGQINMLGQPQVRMQAKTRSIFLLRYAPTHCLPLMQSWALHQYRQLNHRPLHQSQPHSRRQQ